MDTSTLLIELAAIFLLILANGFFALSEFSIIASRKSRLLQKIADGKRGAATAEKLHRKPDRFLATIQVGITLVGTLAGVFGGATVVGELETLFQKVPSSFVANSATALAIAVIAILITGTTVIIGELVPKYLALSNPEYFARHVAPPINLFIRVTFVFSSILSKAARAVLNLLGVKQDAVRSAVTEEEINLMIFEGREKGIFDATEERLVKSVFEFADMTVRRAMTPRTDVVALEINASPKDILNVIIENEYSRYPIYEKDIDHIIGVLYTKDIIIHKLDPNLIIIKDLIRKSLFVPDSMPLSRLLETFQKKKKHLAIVLDEFGGTAGIITLEDILEELVGEIQDEYDAERPPLVKHSDSIVYADGLVWPGEINELMGSTLPEDKAETLAGLFISHLGRLPEKDETVTIGDMLISVLEREDNRLVRLKLAKIAGKTTMENKQSGPANE
ncbi:MAG: HlyC/CorC family transporter [Candidatus Zixiibacteriota bacterium]|nr:MAG: HlyC/CorC family transporter [candidate division Zixibacteria bacterium]